MCWFDAVRLGRLHIYLDARPGQWPDLQGIIARFRFVKAPDGWRIEKAEYIPTLVDLGPPIRLRDLSSDKDIPAIRKTQALDRIDKSALSRNAADHGLTRPGR